MDRHQAGDTGGRVLLILACLIVVIAGLKAASGLILPFLISIFLAMITLPLLNWLKTKGIPSPVAVPVTIVAALLVLSAIVVLVGGSLRDFAAEAPKYQERLRAMSTELLQYAEDRGVYVPQNVNDFFRPEQAIDLVNRTLRGLAAVLSNTLFVLLTIIFILSEAAGFPDKLYAAFGPRPSSHRLIAIRQEVQRYLGIKTLVSIATGLLVGTAMTIIGVDFPLVWGVLAFLMNYIPALGSILAAVPPMLLAIVQLGWGHALAVAIVFLAVNMILGNLVEPYFMGRRLGLSTLVVFLSLVFWGWVWGPIGMLLSVPLTMIVKIMLENTEDLKWIAILLGEHQPAAK